MDMKSACAQDLALIGQLTFEDLGLELDGVNVLIYPILGMDSSLTLRTVQGSMTAPTWSPSMSGAGQVR